MRIAIDVRSLMEGRLSGVEEYTTQIIRGLLRVAPEHSYHLFYNSARPVQLPQFSGNVSLHGFHYPNKLFNTGQLLLGVPRWNSLVDANCFFVPSLRLLPLVSAIPLVTTVHDLSFERFPEFFSLRRRAWHKLMRPRQLIKQSTHVIAVSQATADDIQQLYGIRRDKISVVHSGVAAGDRPNANRIEQVKQRHRLPEKFVLYFGTLEPRKNIPSIIAAFAAIADTVPHDLILAGVRGWLTNEIDTAIRESGIASRIHRPGFITEEDKSALYAAADLFVYPSFYEGFGFPPLEALLAGTPVITSNNSSLPEIVGEWATLIDPHSPSELALVLKELLTDLPIVSEASRHEITQRYSWDKAAHQTLSIIREATAKN